MHRGRRCPAWLTPLVRRCALPARSAKQRNYNNMKNKKNTPDRIELMKYCPFCKKHTAHRETK